MCDESFQADTPLAIVAVRRPAAALYTRAVRKTSRLFWMFTVPFMVSAYFFLTAALQLPATFGIQNDATDALRPLCSTVLNIAIFLLLFRGFLNRKANKQQAFARARRDTGMPSVYRFFTDRVECTGQRDRFVLVYDRVLSAVEDRDGFYLNGDGLVLILPAAELTETDVSFVRTLLRRQLPDGVFRCRRQAVGQLPYPHPIPLYPDREVLPPQVPDLPQYHRPSQQTFFSAVIDALPLLMLLQAAMAGILVFCFDLQERWMPAALFIALLLFSLFPLSLFAQKHIPPQHLLGLSETEGGWRVYHTAGEWFFLPDEVVVRCRDDLVMLFTPIGLIATSAVNCREIPALWAKINQ